MRLDNYNSAARTAAPTTAAPAVVRSAEPLGLEVDEGAADDEGGGLDDAGADAADEAADEAAASAEWLWVLLPELDAADTTVTGLDMAGLGLRAARATRVRRMAERE